MIRFSVVWNVAHRGFVPNGRRAVLIPDFRQPLTTPRRSIPMRVGAYEMLAGYRSMLVSLASNVG